MGISGTRGDLRKDVENGDLGRERGDLLEVFYHARVRTQTVQSYAPPGAPHEMVKMCGERLL